MIELFLGKIVATLLKKVAVGGLIKAAASAYEIYSIFDTLSDFSDCLQSTNNCNQLSVSGVQVISDPLVGAAIDKLITVGSTTFEVQRTKSGLYVASSLVPKFALSNRNFPGIETLHFPQFENRQFPSID